MNPMTIKQAEEVSNLLRRYNLIKRAKEKIEYSQIVELEITDDLYLIDEDEYKRIKDKITAQIIAFYKRELKSISEELKHGFIVNE